MFRNLESVLNRRRILYAGASAMIASFSPSASAAEDEAKAYMGAFRHAGGDKERAARDSAIEDVVSGMSFLVRKIARDRLTSANPIASDLKFSKSATSLTVVMDKRSFTGPLDGSKTKVKSISGDDMDMSYDITSKSLTQKFEADKKGRVNIFTLDGDKRLGMKVRVYAEQLPKDLVYRLTYERA